MGRGLAKRGRVKEGGRPRRHYRARGPAMRRHGSGVGWIGIDWDVLGWIEMGWDGLRWIGIDWVHRNRFEIVRLSSLVHCTQ